MKIAAGIRATVLTVVINVAAPLAAGAAVGPPTDPQAALSQVFSQTPAFSQQAYLKAFNNNNGTDTFGISVAIDGTTVVVGAPGEDSNETGVGDEDNGANDSASSAGAAYVYVLNGATWVLQAYLKASNTDAQDNFGAAVAISGDTIVVGAPKEDSDGTSEANDTLADSGAVYVFLRTGSTWTQQAYIKPTVRGAQDAFGTALAIDGNSLIVGVPDEDSNTAGVNGDPNNDLAGGSGAAYVYTRSGSVWSQQAYIKASSPSNVDHFGDAVDIDGDTAIVGAPNEDGDAVVINGTVNESSSDSGAAYVFTRSGTAWSQQAYIKAPNNDLADNFGTSVAVDGDTAAIGAPGEASNAVGIGGNQANDDVNAAGAAYVFTRTAASWSFQAYVKAPNTSTADLFGSSISVDSDRLLVGAFGAGSEVTGVNPFGDDTTNFSGGSAYLYTRSGAAWTATAFIKPSNSDEGDQFSESLGLSGNLMVMGSRFEDGNAAVINGDDTNDSFGNSGAAYIFGPACASAPFSDVPTSHAFCAAIEWMDQTHISTGFGDGTYRPSLGVTRQAMSAFITRFESATLASCTTPPFTDVPITHPFCKEIKWMKDNGISTGFGDGTFQPAGVVTRQAMSAFMTRVALNFSRPACDDPPFTDVPTTSPFCDEILWMKDNGISTGFGDGTYKPGNPVTRQAMASFMYRLSAFLLEVN